MHVSTPGLQRSRPMPFKSSIEGENFGLNCGAQPLRLRQRRGQPPSSIRGWCAAPKAIGPAPYESILERDAQTLINVDPAVQEYGVQCHRLIYWTPDGLSTRRREYIPDLVINKKDGTVLVVEVKASGLAAMDAWTKVEGHIRRAYEDDHDANFIVLTEQDIRREPRLSNAQVMLAHRGKPPAEIEFALMGALESENGLVSIRGLSTILDQLGITYEQTFAAVMQCAWDGKLKLDATQPYSPMTRVWAGA